MSLTSAQLTTFKAAILAQTTTIPAGQPWTGAFAGVQIKNVPNSGDGNIAVSGWYNLVASPAYLVWNTVVNLKAIRSLVNLANYTPTDNPPASGTTVQLTNDAMLFQNRALACQLKQGNAIFLITGEGQIDCSPLQLRQNFNDCMTTIPSGASGVNQNAGWGTSATPGAVRLAMQRSATNAEKLFAVASTAAPNAGNVGTDARGSATNPDTLVFDGFVAASDVLNALNS